MLLSIGVYAGSNTQKITAYLNKGLTLEVDGEVLKPTEDDGSRLYPIVYNGRTYVPAKVVANALGASVDYDSSGNGTVIITSGNSNDNEGQPTKDGENSNNSNTNTNTNTSTNSNSNIKSVGYDSSKQSTWLKLVDVKISNLPGSSSSNHRLLEVTFKNVSTNTVKYSSYGDLRIYGIDDEEFTSIVGIGSKYPSSGTIKPGETQTFYKGFVADSIDDLRKLEYYPLSAKKGDRTTIYNK
ncbi:stalk domain-containing protein [Ruminiclostridium papyrosolvens]|nr:stalk domain-containing protein [Ruminiclostridium papyrosolvens]